MKHLYAFIKETFINFDLQVGTLKMLFISILLLQTFQSNGQDNSSYALKYNIQHSYPPPIPIMEEQRLILPFKRLGNLIAIEATIDGKTGLYILDTGAPHLVLNKKYFPKATSLSGIHAEGVTGSISEVMQTKIREISFGGLSYHHIHADVIDLTHLEEKKGEQIFGLLGFNLFKKFELIIDYHHSNITLHLLSKKGVRLIEDSLSAFIDLQPKVSLHISRKLIIIQAEINQRKLYFCLDTGAETNILHKGISRKILNDIDIIGKVFISGIGKQRAEAFWGFINRFKLGNVEYQRIKTTFLDLQPMSNVYDSKIDGLLGYDFLSNTTFAINFQKAEMRVW